MNKEIIIPIGIHFKLHGELNIPPESNMLVIFSHGSGSSRFSPRNKFVAEEFNKEKIATLLTDLLTDEEDSIYENRFDIDLLTERLVDVTNYVQRMPELKYFSIGYFGASTGAASALEAAARLKPAIKAIVSRGGRPDMAEKYLASVKAPVLFIVGGDDDEVVHLNKEAFHLLRCEKKMEIIEGATHLFEEEGKLEEVASLACNWFKEHLQTKEYIFSKTNSKRDEV
jgi:pimeloyl-ACP methyl ester carboxylesterase